MPAFYPEGNTATMWSNELRTLHKINDLLGGGGGIIVAGVFYPDTVALMKAIATAATNKRAFLGGLLALGDGFGSTYYWDPTNTASDTDGFGNQLLNVIRPNDNPVPAPGLWVQYTA